MLSVCYALLRSTFIVQRLNPTIMRTGGLGRAVYKAIVVDLPCSQVYRRCFVFLAPSTL